MAEFAHLMLRLTRTLADLRPSDPLPDRLCAAYVSIVGARGGAIALGYGASERSVLSATDEMAARYEDAQDLVREGPSLDAWRRAEAVVSTSVEDQVRRWPELSRVAQTLATGCLYALPMRPGQRVVGVLTSHFELGASSTCELSEMQFLSDAVGAALIGDLPSYEEQRMWSERDLVSQATGMVIAQLHLSAADGLALLRAHAFAQETSVVEISRHITARTLDFTTLKEDGHHE